MIIGLGHQAQVGKDTIAGYLVEKYGFTRLAFADQLKLMALDLNPTVEYGIHHPSLHAVVDRVGWEEAKKEPAIRRFLQNLGVAVRDRIDPDAWVTVVRNRIKAADEAFGEDFVITDVRFPNEFDGLAELGAHLVKVHRTQKPSVVSHISETALLHAPWHYHIYNDQTLDVLHLEVDRLVNRFETRSWNPGYSE